MKKKKLKKKKNRINIVVCILSDDWVTEKTNFTLPEDASERFELSGFSLPRFGIFG